MLPELMGRPLAKITFPPGSEGRNVNNGEKSVKRKRKRKHKMLLLRA